MEVLVFKFKGPFAHFRRVYTTTSASTYSFPPRPAILGLIGAILGINSKPRAFHLKTLKDVKVSVVIENRIDRLRLPINLISTKEDHKRLQIPLELIRNPSYIIFVSSEQFDKFWDLEKLVKNRESLYTPCLGLSELIAIIEYIGTFTPREVEPPCMINSVLPVSKFKMKFRKGVLYLKERTTRAMDENRRYLEHESYVLTPDAKPIEIVEAIDDAKIFEISRWKVTWL